MNIEKFLGTALYNICDDCFSIVKSYHKWWEMEFLLISQPCAPKKVCKRMNIFSDFEHNLYPCSSEFESQCCIVEIATLYSQDYAITLMLRVQANFPSQRNYVVTFSNIWTLAFFYRHFYNLFSELFKSFYE